ncbi:hypothetical protein AAC387_Pa06g0039 [Persea americana]
MASNPPIEVEDQMADEDFFDKLVDDSFGIEESRTGTGSEGVSESDDSAKKANENVGGMPIGNAGTVSEGSDPSASGLVSTIELSSSMIPPEMELEISAPPGEITSLVSSNSSALETETELGDPVTMTRDVALDSMPVKSSSGSRGGGVTIKQVDWSAFNTDSAREEPYSDFFNELADSSVDPFAEVGDMPNSTYSFSGNQVADSATTSGLSEHQQDRSYGNAGVRIQDGQDLYTSQYWENLYAGWKLDPISGQWYQLDGYNVDETTHMDSQEKGQPEGADVLLDHRSEVFYSQQSTQSVVGAVVDESTTGCVSSWIQASQGSIEYPSNMVFDPQYPGWYYDTTAQEWSLLESYTQAGAVQMSSTGNEQKTQDGSASVGGFSEKDQGLYSEFNQFEQYKSQNQGAQWVGSGNNHAQSNMWQSEQFGNKGAAMGYTVSKQTENFHGSMGYVDNCANQQMVFKKIETASLYGHADNSYDGHAGENGFQSFASAENLHQYNQKVEYNQQRSSSPDCYGKQTSINYDQQPFHSGNNSNMSLAYVQNEARSSAGRPPHALVTFGFGGKLVVMKDDISSYGNQGTTGGSISILNLMEVVVDKIQSTSFDTGACDYFCALSQQSFPGPLVGGNAANKDLYKWIDERITNCQSPNMDFKKGELLRLILSLLKICCQHYGKLRSPFGVDSALQESDGPELAVAKLFASARRNGAQLSDYGAVTHCMQNLPTERQIRTTAVEVQNLLVSGRRKEALQCAQVGQLWGPALVLAAQLGEKFYVDTVKQMAHRQFVPGSPLRTLCLLIAGQPADVFSGDSSINASPFSPFLANGMLDDWEENLAVIAANRTKDDELVIIHLGDCLWKERGQIAAAHTCYLVAEANFESYSDSARLCLIGADHWKCPRTYASPEAIQRTELYEYSKVLGNSQFILLPLQPYKLIYAHMLAEVGKVSESLRYCQAILKTLKNSSRAPEVETWKSMLLSFEERIKTHQQGGYGTNLAPAKLVGKLFTSIDRSIHRMIGTPPPLPSTSQSSFLNSEHDNHSKVANSKSTMEMSSLAPSASMERISEWTDDNNRMAKHNRSISEPDFGRSPKQVSPKKLANPAGGKSSIAGGPSRFGRFGSQLLQKTMGWVSRSRQDRQAKLGEKNKFYYDEKLKRWVEEGAELPVEEAALPPPPTTTSFQSSASDKSQSLPSPESRSPNSSEHSKGLPPIPPSANQFSSRGRMGVRSRYVDTFNKNGGNNAKLFQSPAIQVPKAAGGAKFFVPTPTSSVDQTGESIQDAATSEEPSASAANELSFSSISSSTPSLQRFPSMNNIAYIENKGMKVSGNGSNTAPSHSRAASWSGSYNDMKAVSWNGGYNDMFNAKSNETKPPGEALCRPLSAFMVPSDPSPTGMVKNGSSGDDLREVAL